MNLIATMPVRNESWILGLSARAALMWVDHLVLCDHRSTDNTPAICDQVVAEHPGRVTVIQWPDEEWTEMAQRQFMLDKARDLGASHIALVDADEILTANLLPSIRIMITSTPPLAIFQLPWLCMRGGADRVISAGPWAKAEVSTAFLDDAIFHWKAREGYDFHHRHPMGIGAELKVSHLYRPMPLRTGGLMHMQFASRRRLIAKHYLYQLTERLRWPDRRTALDVNLMYSNTVRTSDSAPVSQVPASWWSDYDGLARRFLDIDQEPWQIEQCRKMIAAHPGIEHGLNSFGLSI